MDLSGGDNDGLIQPKGSPRIPRKKRGNTPHHQGYNNNGHYSSHRSNSSGSSQKRGSNNSNQIHNTAGRRAGNRIRTPTTSSSPNLDDIYSDNSPNHRGSSGNRGGRVPRYTENDSSDSSRFSSTDSKTVQTSDDDNNKRQQKLRRKREKERKQKQRDKELRKKQNTKRSEPECIDLEEDDNTSTNGCFDGVAIDKPANPQAENLMNRWKEDFGIADDDNEDIDRGRGKDKKNFRGANHNSSLVHSLDKKSPDKMQRKDREQRGYSRRDERGGRIFNSKEEDPLDQAASEQASNHPTRSGENDVAVYRTKFTKSMGGNMSKLLNSNASMMSNRTKRKKKPEKNEKREQCARAAISRSDSMDSSSSEGGHKLSSGEKRKPQYDGRQSSNKRRSRDSSEHSAIDVDGNDEILNAVSAAGGQRYTPPPQSWVSRADAALNTSNFGIKKAPASIKSAKNKKKTSPINNMHSYLKGTKRHDDITGFDDKPKQKKPNKTMSKMRRNGAVLEDEPDNGPNKDGWHDRISEQGKPKSRGRRNKTTQSQLPDYNTTSTSTRTTRSRSRTRGGKKKENEVIEIDDSSSDEGDDTSVSETFADQSARSMRAVGDVASIDAVRIAVGKKVFRSKCMLSFQFGTKDPYIQFSFESKGKRIVKKSEHRVYLKSEDLREVKYHIPDEFDNSDENDEDSMTVIAFRITPTENNDLEKYSSSYKQVDSDDDQKNNHKRYISVEVRDADDFKAMLDQMRQHPDLEHWCTEDSEIEFYNLDKYTKALVDDSRKERNERMSVSKRTRSGGSKKKKDSENKLLVVYPFGVDEAILSEAASGLKELGGDLLGLDYMNDKKPPAASAMQGVQSDVEDDGKGKSSRTHYVTIRDDDVERLCPGEFLNDTLVDFWMRWISRGEANNSYSNVHFFTSHFMTTLKNDGPESVASWTAKKSINVFQKKLIFIPVNADLHWSLCVVVNPGLIANCFDESVEETEEHACLLFLDSLKMHSKNMYAKHIRKWLNCEWKRLGRGSIAGKDEPFLLKSIPLLSPKIPYQENGCDCGVFVNRYAYSLYMMRHLKFTWVDIEEHFKSMITRGQAFQFDMEDIARIRGEIGTLINNLSEIYLAMKAQEKKEKKKLKQVVKSSEEEKQSDIGSAPKKSDTPSDSSTVLEGGETAGEEMNDEAGVAGDGDASDAKMPPSEEKENVVQEESQKSVVEVAVPEGKLANNSSGSDNEVMEENVTSPTI